MTVELAGTTAITRFAHLQNEPTDIILDWESVNRQDKLMHAAASNLGRAYSIHSDTFFAGSEYKEMREYTRRYRHANSLLIADSTAKPDYRNAISLYHADQDSHFSAHHRKLMEQLFPHMVEALTHNRLLSLRQTGISDAATEEDTGAIARADGQLCYAGSSFNRLLQEEWSDWKGVKLPKTLLGALGRGGTARLLGERATVLAACVGDLIYLRAFPRSRMTRLSPRELAIAKLYGRGLSHKDVATQLEIAPTTARNVIQKIFAKLEISSKAELAGLLIGCRR